MELFWRHGYEGVSVADLTSAIGIAAPSLYAAFGSKAGLYREVIARYETRDAAAHIALMDGAPDAETAARRMLESVVGMLTACSEPRCCMIASGMVACSAEHEDIAGELAARRDHFRVEMASRLGRWMEPEQAASLARYLIAVIQGISVQARDGASARELARIVEAACVVFRAPAPAQ
ncbi:TetR/AcrR family transcriptional regulator [Oceanicella sp. SM1341]|uniref:TetR/AcrR family transcriptional regulator n=1 Tax=Oceanicella sp. SM1341 TaxID=1548889 RepID=UPI0018E54DE3|nr:TetR/AcrR family transcriptional regulator [Oceanicella sp. SM1341]